MQIYRRCAIKFCFNFPGFFSCHFFSKMTFTDPVLKQICDEFSESFWSYLNLFQFFFIITRAALFIASNDRVVVARPYSSTFRWSIFVCAIQFMKINVDHRLTITLEKPSLTISTAIDDATGFYSDFKDFQHH